MRKFGLAGLGLIVFSIGTVFWYRANYLLPAASNTMLVSGNIEAHESLISFKAVQSRIIALPFDEGAWVNSGSLLARLDDADYRKQVDVDRAALNMQQQNLAAAIEK